MGFNEEERQSTPPPWGWPPAAEEKAHGVGEIVYHGAAKPTRHTKDRCHEQEKVYHKTRSRATPHGQAARDAGHGMERIREPLRADIAAALRESPQHPVLHVAARWTYPEYDIDKARASINEGRGNMGAPMKLTVGMAILFRHAVLNLRRSPYDARIMIKEAMPDRDVPCLKTFYNHIEAGDTGVFRGQTPYHPGRRRKARQPAHEARTVPGRRLLEDRPKEASEARELGHWEMDTVISGRGSRGGLLVMLDRCSRRYVIEHLSHISQDDVVMAIRKMKARKALPVIRSVTTDNGCEFLDQKRLDRVFKAETYYTRAYASYEKGAIENCNRLVRRWYPKGTDFNQLTRRQIRQLEDWINSIHRESLNGETAYAYDSRMAQAA